MPKGLGFPLIPIEPNLPARSIILVRELSRSAAVFSDAVLILVIGSFVISILKPTSTHILSPTARTVPLYVGGFHPYSVATILNSSASTPSIQMRESSASAEPVLNKLTRQTNSAVESALN